MNGGSYNYFVRCQDQSSNPNTNDAAITFAVASPAPADTTPPVVTMTAPAPNATVSGSVTVSANASDNVGVAGVQFLLNGAPLGAEDTTAPYSITWSSTSVANGGPYQLSARARDAATNQTTSSAVSVTVNNTSLGLVAAYNFNQGTGTTLEDRTGSGRTGTISGATWTAQGKYGSALTFDGVNDWVTVADANSLDLTTAMTLEAWVYPTASGGGSWRTVLIKERPSGEVYNLYANADTNVPVVYVVRAAQPGQPLDARGTAALPLNTWTHLAVTYRQHDAAAVRERDAGGDAGGGGADADVDRRAADGRQQPLGRVFPGAHRRGADLQPRAQRGRDSGRLDDADTVGVPAPSQHDPYPRIVTGPFFGVNTIARIFAEAMLLAFPGGDADSRLRPYQTFAPQTRGQWRLRHSCCRSWHSSPAGCRRAAPRECSRFWRYGPNSRGEAGARKPRTPPPWPVHAARAAAAAGRHLREVARSPQLSRVDGSLSRPLRRASRFRAPTSPRQNCRPASAWSLTSVRRFAVLDRWRLPPLLSVVSDGRYHAAPFHSEVTIMNSKTNRTQAGVCASWAVPTLGLFAVLLLAVPAATRQSVQRIPTPTTGICPTKGTPAGTMRHKVSNHDDSSWYITQNPTSSFTSEAFGARPPEKCSLNSRTNVWTCPNPRLWRSPASLSLGQGVACGDPATAGPDTPVCTSLHSAAPFLWQLGYDHFGDIDYYKPEGQPGYVCVPLEGKLSDLPSLPGAFAFFRADDLSFVAWAVAPGMNAVSAWCAIDDSGHIYSGPRTPADFTGMVNKYELNWAGLALDVPTPDLALVGTMALLDKNGNSLSLSKYLQGGTFANANLLYLLNGQGNEECPDCGIHVFEVSHNTTGGPCGVTDGDCSARRVAQSTRGDGAFKYEFHPGWSRYEEPEGLTWWDLTAPNAPAVPGVTSSGLPVADTQLHAILLDNDLLEDDVYVKHYRVEVPPMTGIAVDPSVVAFDRTDVGASKTETVRVSNHGSADLSLNALEIAGGGGMFTFASPIVPPIVLAPEPARRSACASHRRPVDRPRPRCRSPAPIRCGRR